jgi:hypothetical protein
MEKQEIQFKGPAAYVSNLELARRFYEGLLGLQVSRVMSRDGKPIAVAYTAGLSIWDVDDAFSAIFGSPAMDQHKHDRPAWENARLKCTTSMPCTNALSRQDRHSHILCASFPGGRGHSACTIPMEILSTSAKRMRPPSAG